MLQLRYLREENLKPRTDVATQNPDQYLSILSSRTCVHSCIYFLQSTAMAFPKVDEQSVYRCVGQPTPDHMEQVLKVLLNDSLPVVYTSENFSIFFVLCLYFPFRIAIRVGKFGICSIGYCRKASRCRFHA